MLRDTATKHHHASNASHSLSSPPAPSASASLPFSPSRCDTAQGHSAMGQAESAVRQPEPDTGLQQGQSFLPPPSPQPKAKSRFGWSGRRKKSEDLTKLMNPPIPSSLAPPSLAPPPPSSLHNTSKGRDLSRQDSNVSSVESSTSGGLNMHELSRPPSRTASAKQLTLQFASNTLTALRGKLNASQASIHSLRASTATSPTTPPPPLPPKPDMSRHSSSSSTCSESSSGDWVPLEKSGKPLPSLTPDLSGPVTKTRTPQLEMVPTATTAAGSASTEHGHDVSAPKRRERERREGADAQTAKEIADDWRKSDSTLRTVRLVGSRTPRPLSLAESTNSAHTVLPSMSAGSPAGNMSIGAGKRLSALMTDADFGLKEVDSEDDDDDEQSVFASSAPPAFNSVYSFQQEQSFGQGTTTYAQPAPRRGSLSIRLGRFSSKNHVSEHGQLSGSDSEMLSSSVSTQGTGTDMGMLTANSSTTSVTSSSPGIGTKHSRPSIEIASSASIASSLSSEHRPEVYAQYKANSKLEPWTSLPPTASDSQASLSTSESASTSSHRGGPGRHTDGETNGKHTVDIGPPQGTSLRPAHQRTRLQSIQARGFRQTAVSLTTGFAPAAGFARKAVDRLGRALAGSSTSLANADADDAHIVQADARRQGHAPSASASNASLFGMTGQNQNSRAYGHHQHHRRHPPQHPPSSSKKAMRKHDASPSGTWSVNSSSTTDTDGGPSGPNLGPCLRNPLITPSGGKGLVFGRELGLCVKDTACNGLVENGVDGLSLEGRSLPALVVRCAQHIVKWGVQEEGLFRISGRPTHISKLRAEFDSGADYDLRQCGPGEIDPHAVSSIFKAYLRELPEPLLTRHLMPYFEAALTAENNMNIAADAQNTGGTNHSGFEQTRGPGLPSSPRDSVQVRKAPSLSTFAVPTLVPRIASHTLLSALSALIARLPKENRDLLQTVTELIMATAHASRETKMPLSNLLLVFCPSLMMNPPLLRVLCEGKEIWDGPLEDVKTPPFPGDSSSSNTNCDEKTGGKKDGAGIDSGRKSHDGEAGLHHQQTIRRAPTTPNEATVTKSMEKEKAVEAGPTTATVTLPSLVLPSNDEASVTSAHSKTDSSISASFILSSPDRNTHSSNSSDSLHTPPSSIPGNASSNNSPAPGAVMKPGVDTNGLTNKIVVLRAQSDLPSPSSPSASRKAVRKSLIGNPVPFPLGIGTSRSSSANGSVGSAPVTPIEPGGSDKFSLASHSSSSPNLSRDGTSNSPTGTPPRRRKSKASLLGLKSKRSLSSLLGLAQEQTPARSLRPAVTSTGLAEERDREPPPRSLTPCPVLEIPVEASQIQLGEGLGISLGAGLDGERPTAVPSTPRIQPPSPSPSASPSRLRPQDSYLMMDRAESDSSAMTNSVFYTPPTTTRALAPAANSLSVSSSTSSGSGSCSFLDFKLGHTEEDDWARSVLQAAASDS